MKKYSILSEPEEIYSKMLSDIKKAKKEILLETYIFGNDKIGRKFRDVLIDKAKEGIHIKLLLDGWGSGVKKSFFKKLISSKGKVRFFREFRYVFRIFIKNHERNHRKLLLIDNKISYLGSINITSSCLEWRELVLRFDSDISEKLRKSFFRSWRRYRDLNFKKMKKIVGEKFEIIHDFPSILDRPTEKSYKKLIKKAKKEILIETPYFIPSFVIRSAINKAIKRGVVVKVLVPYSSDVKVVDIFRNRYLGNLHRKGVQIFYYSGKLHSKYFLVDEKYFLLGSSNLDYRSFLHQYEINLFGENEEISKKLKLFFESGIKKSINFNYEIWQKRHFLSYLLEKILYPIKNYL